MLTVLSFIAFAAVGSSMARIFVLIPGWGECLGGWEAWVWGVWGTSRVRSLHPFIDIELNDSTFFSKTESSNLEHCIEHWKH